MNVDLVLFKKNGSHKTFALQNNITVMGRRHDCDLCIPLKAVSRRHCQLYSNDDKLRIRDLGSRNGTYLNGKRVDDAMVKAGDYLKVGPLTFLLRIDNEPQEIVPPGAAAPKAAAKKEPVAEMKGEGDLDAFPEFDDSDSLPFDLDDV